MNVTVIISNYALFNGLKHQTVRKSRLNALLKRMNGSSQDGKERLENQKFYSLVKNLASFRSAVIKDWST